MSSRAKVIELASKLYHQSAIRGQVLGDAWFTANDHNAVEFRSHEPLEHIEPGPHAMLAAWSSRFRKGGGRVEIHHSLQSPYAYRVGLLSTISGRPQPANVIRNHLPPVRVRSQETRQLLYDRLAHAFEADALGVRTLLQRGIGEALHNVDEHARSDDGCFVTASYFPNAGRVSIAVADTGVGVPTTIRNRYGPNLTDLQANTLAVEPQVSGAPPLSRGGTLGGLSSNAGLGLFVMRGLAAQTHGLFSLVSGSAYVMSKGRWDEITKGNLLARWPGTLVCMTFTIAFGDEAMRTMRAVLDRGFKPNRKTEMFSWGRPPNETLSTTISPSFGSVVDDKREAIKLRDDRLLPAVQSRGVVHIDLRSAQIITHSCAHALLFELIRHAGASSRELIWVSAKSRTVKDTLRLVGWLAKETLDKTVPSEPAAPT